MLKILPERFRAINVFFGDIDELSLDLGKRNSSFSINAIAAGPNKVDVVLKIRLIMNDDMALSVDYGVEFAVKDDSVENFVVNEEVLKDVFIQVNAPAIAYPFLRSYISTITVNSGYEHVLLPPVNFQAFYAERQKAGKLDGSILIR